MEINFILENEKIKMSKLAIDVIFLSKTADYEIFGITYSAINSLILNNQDYDFNINIVESNINLSKQGFSYLGHNVIIPDENFNYNKFLNIGLRFCKNEWVLICNNDLFFTKGCINTLLTIADKHSIKSLSPWNPLTHDKIFSNEDKQKEHIPGYKTAHELAGWCILVRRDVINNCEMFDERFEFWYQDNDYGETLKNNNIIHTLVPTSKVYHLTSRSFKLITENIPETALKQKAIFLEKHPKAVL